MPKLNAADLVKDFEEAAASPLEQSPEPEESFGDLQSLLGDSIPVTKVEAPGIGVDTVRDPFSGRTWTIPSGELADNELLTYRSPRDFPKDPNFHYEIQSLAELPYYMQQDFVPVTRREIGMQNLVRIGEALPTDSLYVIDGTDVAIKIPKILGERRYSANKRLCDAAMKGIDKGQIHDASGQPVVEMDPNDADSRFKSRLEVEETRNDLREEFRAGKL